MHRVVSLSIRPWTLTEIRICHEKSYPIYVIWRQRSCTRAKPQLSFSWCETNIFFSCCCCCCCFFFLIFYFTFLFSVFIFCFSVFVLFYHHCFTIFQCYFITYKKFFFLRILPQLLRSSRKIYDFSYIYTFPSHFVEQLGLQAIFSFLFFLRPFTSSILTFFFVCLFVSQYFFVFLDYNVKNRDDGKKNYAKKIPIIVCIEVKKFLKGNI